MNIRELVSPAIARRLLYGFGAGLLGKVGILGIQLVSVPALTLSWGGAGFGIWAMVNAVPSFIALSDFGVGQAVATRLTHSVERGDRVDALKVYQSGWVFLTSLTGVLCFSVGVFALLWSGFPADRYETSSQFSMREISAAVMLSAAYSFASLQMNMQRSILQATQKFALSAILADGIFLIGGLSVAATAMLGGGIVAAAGTQLVCQISGLIAVTFLARKLEPWARLGWRNADRVTMKSLIGPSLGAFSLTLANSVGLQGAVVAVGWFVDPSAAGVFSTCRMLSRIPLQLSALLTRASLPELIHVRVSGDHGTWKRLSRINVGLSLSIMIPVTLMLTAFGSSILHTLSHGELKASHTLFALLGAGALCCSAWTSLAVQLLAENRQSRFGYIALAVYAVSAATPIAFSGSLLPTAGALIVADVIILVRVIRCSWKGTADWKPRDTE